VRSGKIFASNDYLIDKLIEDPNFDIREDGTIWTLLTIYGNKSSEWRKVGREDPEGYLIFQYKRKKIFIHRAVYRKFVGKLESDLVVNHKDSVNSNNVPSNLELITQKENINYKFRRLGINEETY
jgi:hypothetical protein